MREYCANAAPWPSFAQALSVRGEWMLRPVILRKANAAGGNLLRRADHRVPRDCGSPEITDSGHPHVAAGGAAIANQAAIIHYPLGRIMRRHCLVACVGIATLVFGLRPGIAQVRAVQPD